MANGFRIEKSEGGYRYIKVDTENEKDTEEVTVPVHQGILDGYNNSYFPFMDKDNFFLQARLPNGLYESVIVKMGNQDNAYKGQYYGDLVELNTCRVIADSISQSTLNVIVKTKKSLYLCTFAGTIPLSIISCFRFASS